MPTLRAPAVCIAVESADDVAHLLDSPLPLPVPQAIPVELKTPEVNVAHPVAAPVIERPPPVIESPPAIVEVALVEVDVKNPVRKIPIVEDDTVSKAAELPDSSLSVLRFAKFVLMTALEEVMVSVPWMTVIVEAHAANPAKSTNPAIEIDIGITTFFIIAFLSIARVLFL